MARRAWDAASPLVTVRVPIVPAAVALRPHQWRRRNRPSRLRLSRVGRAACEAAARTSSIGSVGAGTGATTADLKGGFGTARDGARRRKPPGGLRCRQRRRPRHARHDAAFPRRAVRAGRRVRRPRPPGALPPDAGGVVTETTDDSPARTPRSRSSPPTARFRARRQSALRSSPHDGIALAIFPAHTPFDGDTVFVLADRQAGVLRRAARRLLRFAPPRPTTLARAIARGVYAATPRPATACRPGGSATASVSLEPTKRARPSTRAGGAC